MEYHEEEQEDHEEEEEEEEEEEDEGDDEEDDEELPAAAPATYENSLSNPARLAEQATAAAWAGGQAKPAASIRYKECRKNHAIGIGGHAVDGCGEFMASGAEGTLDALKCAACSCHRNFHRKENYRQNSSSATATSLTYPLALVEPPPPHYQPRGGPPQYHHPHQLPPPPPASWYQVRVGPRPLALPPVASDVVQEGPWNNVNSEDMNNVGGRGGVGGGSSSSRKRFRTKFTQEQKERMLELAEKLGWRIQKHDEAEVERFCSETGVKRQVLKVWMHNNKHTLGKKP